MVAFVAIAIAEVPITEYFGSRTKPVSQRADHGPQGIEPVKKETCSPMSPDRFDANFANTGNVPPISVVGTIIATTANSTRRNERYSVFSSATRARGT